MEKIWSKKLLLPLLLVSLLTTGGYLLAEKSEFHGSAMKYIKGFQSPPQKRTSIQDPPQKSASQPQLSLNDLPEVQQCYQEYLMSEPQVMEGVVLFHWTLTEEGHVDEIRMVSTEFEDDIFTSCVEEAVIKTKFPVSEERLGVKIAHTFRFERRMPSEVAY